LASGRLRRISEAGRDRHVDDRLRLHIRGEKRDERVDAVWTRRQRAKRIAGKGQFAFDGAMRVEDHGACVEAVGGDNREELIRRRARVSRSTIARPRDPAINAGGSSRRQNIHIQMENVLGVELLFQPPQTGQVRAVGRRRSIRFLGAEIVEILARSDKWL
jgi:hypothetical protein